MIEERSIQTVYLGLGCNLGNRLESLEKAILMLGEIGEVIVESKIYESPAWGYHDQRSYLNMCCALQTKLSPEELHQRTLKIEIALGRETSKRKQGEPFRPRMIDIDLLFFGNEVIETDSLNIPHSQLHLRNFVLLPMVDIAPEYRHPVLGQSMLELWNKSKDNTEPVQLI